MSSGGGGGGGISDLARLVQQPNVRAASGVYDGLPQALNTVESQVGGFMEAIYGGGGGEEHLATVLGLLDDVGLLKKQLAIQMDMTPVELDNYLSTFGSGGDG